MTKNDTARENAKKSRLDVHREMARCMYEPQMTAYKTGTNVRLGGAWSAGGEIHEPWTLTTFGPMAGEGTATLNGAPESMDCSPEFQMYWTGIPDFRITDYKVWPTEEGWIARITYGGTARDGTPVLAHQADFVTVDDTGRVVRVEWFVDTNQWQQRVWSKASGKSVDELREMLSKPGGFQKLIEYTHSLRKKS